MQLTLPSKRRSQPGWPVLLAIALAVQAPTALGLGSDTVFLRGNTFIGYDSNIFLADGVLVPVQSDSYYGLGAGIRIDLPVSRQRIRADAYINKYWYSQFSALDYNNYGGSATWEWRVGNDWSGEIGGGVEQSRQAFTDQLGAAFPRLLRTYNALATVRYALTPRWELQGGASAYQARYNDDLFRADNFDSSSLDIGAAYRSPRGNSTGARLTYQQGRWPNQVRAAGVTQYDQYTLAAVLDWRLSGRSRLSGNVGYTQRTGQDQGNFSGPSGTLNYDYVLSGKSTLRTTIYQIRGPTSANFPTYVRTTGITFSPSYQVTGKIGLQGTLGYSQASYLGQQPQREFSYWNVGVNGVYQITRVVRMGAGLTYYWRTSDLPFGDYQGFTATLNVGAEF